MGWKKTLHCGQASVFDLKINIYVYIFYHSATLLSSTKNDGSLHHTMVHASMLMLWRMFIIFAVVIYSTIVNNDLQIQSLVNYGKLTENSISSCCNVEAWNHPSEKCKLEQTKIVCWIQSKVEIEWDQVTGRQMTLLHNDTSSNTYIAFWHTLYGLTGTPRD